MITSHMRLNTTHQFRQQITEDRFPAAVICFDCLTVSEEAAQEDSCQQCGCRYNPNTVGENCPECGSPHFDIHCPACDSDDIEYLTTVMDDWEESVLTIGEHVDTVVNNIAQFVEQRMGED